MQIASLAGAAKNGSGYKTSVQMMLHSIVYRKGKQHQHHIHMVMIKLLFYFIF